MGRRLSTESGGVMRCALRWCYGARPYGGTPASMVAGQELPHREEVGRGVRRGNGSDAGDAEHAGKGVGDALKRARQAVTVGVTARRREERIKAAPPMWEVQRRRCTCGWPCSS
jgi:hypothetical protein